MFDGFHFLLIFPQHPDEQINNVKLLLNVDCTNGILNARHFRVRLCTHNTIFTSILNDLFLGTKSDFKVMITNVISLNGYSPTSLS